MAGGATRGGDAFLASHTDAELRAMAERAVRRPPPFSPCITVCKVPGLF